MKKAAFLFLLAIAAAACSKSSDSQDPATKLLYPAKIVEVNGSTTTTTTYEYDNQNRIAKSISVRVYTGDNGIQTRTITYTYTNDLLTQILNEEDDVTDFVTFKLVLNYTNEKLATIFQYNGTDTEPISKDSLYYSNGSLPNVITQDNGFITNTLTYDALGNATSILYSDKQGTNFETTINYDTDHPYYMWCIPDPTNVTRQFKYCPTQYREVGKAGGVTTSDVITSYTYTFNAQGYPITATETTTDGISSSPSVITYNITYK